MPKVDKPYPGWEEKRDSELRKVGHGVDKRGIVKRLTSKTRLGS